MTAVSLVDSEDTACSTATAGGAQNRRATCKVRRLQRQHPSQKQEVQHILQKFSKLGEKQRRAERQHCWNGSESCHGGGIKKGGKMSCSTSHTHSSDANSPIAGTKSPPSEKGALHCPQQGVAPRQALVQRVATMGEEAKQGEIKWSGRKQNMISHDEEGNE